MDDARATFAERVTALADDPRFEPRRTDLESLAAELRDDDDGLTASWIGIDLVQAFSGTEAVRVKGHHRAERALGLLGLLAVFAPVAWTWWSFHSASKAYRDMIVDGVDQTGTTFLSWWATGFDGRMTGPHLLVPMSVYSVILISIAVALLVAHRMVGSYSERREDEASAAASAELQSCLVGAQRVLNGARGDDPKHFANIVRTSVRHLLKAHEATEAGTHEVQAAARQMSESITPLLESLTLATHNAAGAATSVQSAGTSLVAVVEASDAGVRQAMGDLGSMVSEHTALLRAETTQAMAESTRQTTIATDGLAQQVDRLAQAHDTLTKHVATFAATSDGRDEQIDKALVAVRTAIESLEQTLSLTESAMQGQKTDLTMAHEAAERMLRHLERLASPVGV